MQPTTSIHTGLSTESAKEVEVFPGIHERRFFLGWSLTAAAALLVLEALPRGIFAHSATKAAGTTGSAALSWEAFLKQAVPVAQQLYADPALSVDEYLYRIGSLPIRLNEIPDTKLGQYSAVDPRIWLGPSFRGASPFYIIQWRMEPGAFFPPHNHRNASVCTLGFQGEVRLRNFEILGDEPDYDLKRRFV